MQKKVINPGDFIEQFEENFDLPLSKEISLLTRFRELSEWSSLQALVVISSFEENYGVTFSEAELEKSETVRDLYSIVTTKF